MSGARAGLVRLLACGLLATSLSIHASDPADSPSNPRNDAEPTSPLLDPAPLPSPDLRALEPNVAEQLARAQALWEQHRSGPMEQQVQVLNELAQLYHAYELWEAAQACYRRLLAAQSNRFDLWHLFGHASQQAGDNPQAEQAYRQALALQQAYSASALRLAEVQVLQGRQAEAIELVEGVLKQQPDNTAARLARGELALAEGKPALAIDLLNTVVQAVPQANRSHYLLAQAFRANGQSDLARQHLAKSGSVGVRIPDPLVEQLQALVVGERVALIEGKLAYEAGDFHHAIDRYRAALQAAPESVSAEINLGASLARIGEIELALDHFRRVLQRAPDNLSAHFNLAELLLQAGQPEQAGTHYLTVVRQRPQDVSALLGLARSARLAGDGTSAIQAYQQVLQAAPELSEVWLEYVDSLSGEQRLQQAGAALAQAHALHPDDGQLAHRYAEHLLAAPDQTTASLAQALDLATRVFEARRSLAHADTLARALAANAQCDQAAQLQSEVLAKTPGDPYSEAIVEAKSRLRRYQAGAPCFQP
ncbi:tetratricopeptide repeat protein [Pseudomarimonas arenosa]|uniref:Tetratricopeptide repeat protein n=1 Tax=Pseudomarimonas arenosa TaxID=2774145 RepID=A0AAW3ZUF3_9GAMM|nr:tetratricopeptide repeat protein [Pseudomarimonas arenosa]MBD8527721.1 tetratricopeptide repeat protein [Pseudomarimonas arenosa]